MKKLISMILSATMVAIILAGCGNKVTEQAKTDSAVIGADVEATNDGKKMSIVTTIFPEYDWVREITKGNDNVDITMLLDKGVDLHSFQPTASDIVKVANCDMFIYVGGESDKWVDDALAEAVNKDMVVINLLDVLGDSVKEEEVVEGMEAEEEEEEAESEGEEEEVEYDEHVWLSVKNAEVLCQYIADKLSSIDAENKTMYEENAKNYIAELDALDKEYENAVDLAEIKTVLFGDRFPFRYMVDDYGLDYYAAFVGCSAESEASFETITFLAGKIDELGLSSILQIESADGKIAETVKSNTSDKNQQILTMDSMQSVTAQNVADGEKYLDIMRRNLEILKQALK